MRPGQQHQQHQQKRMRGRNNNNNSNRKGPNPLSRSYESNGPDVKIRGTAAHIADKYIQLARDAQSSGDPVAAENYFQHAEHYYRILAAAQPQFQTHPGFVRADDESRDEDFEGEDGGDGMDGGQNGYQPMPVNAPQPGQNQQREGGYRENGQRENGQREGRDGGYREGRDNGNYREAREPRGDDREGGQNREGQNREGQNRENGQNREGGQSRENGQSREGGQPRGEFREGGRRRERAPRRDLDQRPAVTGEEGEAALPAFITGGQPLLAAAPQQDDQIDAAPQVEGAEGEGGEGVGRRRRRYGRHARGAAEGEAPAPEPEVAPGE